MKPVFTRLPDGSWLLWPEAAGSTDEIRFSGRVNDPLVGPKQDLEKFLQNPHQYPGTAVLHGPYSVSKSGNGAIYRTERCVIELVLKGGILDRHPRRRHFRTGPDARGTIKFSPAAPLASKGYEIRQQHSRQLYNDIEKANRLLGRARGLLGIGIRGKYNSLGKGKDGH